MTDRSIFITGAGSGIGRATAELFHGEGWFVGGYDVDATSLDTLRDDLGDRCTTAVLDVTDKVAFDAAVADFGGRTGGTLDLLFNNAGIAVGGYLDDVPIERLHRMVAVNLIGVLNGVHAATPLLRETPGSLCFTTASSAATFGTPWMATYSATKCAVKGLTEALSVELARYGSRAADVSPGIIDTAIWSSTRFTSGGEEARMPDVPAANATRSDASRTLPASDVARCVWDAYHGDQLHWYVPPEVVDRERARIADPEAMRDELIAQLP